MFAIFLWFHPGIFRSILRNTGFLFGVVMAACFHTKANLKAVKLPRPKTRSVKNIRETPRDNCIFGGLNQFLGRLAIRQMLAKQFQQKLVSLQCVLFFSFFSHQAGLFRCFDRFNKISRLGISCRKCANTYGHPVVGKFTGPFGQLYCFFAVAKTFVRTCG